MSHETLPSHTASVRTPFHERDGAAFYSASADGVLRPMPQSRVNLASRNLGSVSLAGDDSLEQSQQPESCNQYRTEIEPGVLFKFRKTPFYEHGGSLPGKRGPSLDDKIWEYLKEEMSPGKRAELERQERQYEMAVASWGRGSAPDARPPSLKDYPALEKHTHRAYQTEEQIYRHVMESLVSPDRRELLEPGALLGDGFVPVAINEEVNRRLRNATVELVSQHHGYSQQHFEHQVLY